MSRPFRILALVAVAGLALFAALRFGAMGDDGAESLGPVAGTEGGAPSAAESALVAPRVRPPEAVEKADGSQRAAAAPTREVRLWLYPLRRPDEVVPWYRFELWSGAGRLLTAETDAVGVARVEIPAGEDRLFVRGVDHPDLAPPVRGEVPIDVAGRTKVGVELRVGPRWFLEFEDGEADEVLAFDLPRHDGPARAPVRREGGAPWVRFPRGTDDLARDWNGRAVLRAHDRSRDRWATAPAYGADRTGGGGGVTLRFRDTGALELVVVDARGASFEGVRAQLLPRHSSENDERTDPPEPRYPIELHTDEHGRAVFPGLLPGEYRLELRAGTMLEHEEALDVRPGRREHRVTLAPPEGWRPLEVRVRASTGSLQGMVHVRVSAWSGDDAPGGERATVTADVVLEPERSTGHVAVVHFEGVPDGPIEVFAMSMVEGETLRARSVWFEARSRVELVLESKGIGDPEEMLFVRVVDRAARDVEEGLVGRAWWRGGTTALSKVWLSHGPDPANVRGGRIRGERPVVLIAATGFRPSYGPPPPLEPTAPFGWRSLVLESGWGGALWFTDEAGAPIPGVPVRLDGETAATSDARGVALLSTDAPPATVSVPADALAAGGWERLAGSPLAFDVDPDGPGLLRRLVLTRR